MATTARARSVTVWWELALFSIAGTIGFVVDAGILYLLLFSCIGYFTGRAASFLCAVWVTWMINRVSRSMRNAAA